MQLNCPVVGFESVTITIPDEWLIKHNEAFWKAYREAGEVSHSTGLLYGCVAVCDKIEGLPDGSPGDWPLQVYNWFISAVWGSLEKALNPPKNS